MSQVINFLSSSESLKYIFALDAPKENCYVFKNAVERKEMASLFTTAV